eukprot:COSAG04_NODE_1_length_58448_cov_23.476478_10_plen_181_part_00
MRFLVHAQNNRNQLCPAAEADAPRYTFAPSDPQTQHGLNSVIVPVCLASWPCLGMVQYIAYGLFFFYAAFAAHSDIQTSFSKVSSGALLLDLAQNRRAQAGAVAVQEPREQGAGPERPLVRVGSRRGSLQRREQRRRPEHAVQRRGRRPNSVELIAKELLGILGLSGKGSRRGGAEEGRG